MPHMISLLVEKHHSRLRRVAGYVQRLKSVAVSIEMLRRDLLTLLVPYGAYLVAQRRLIPSGGPGGL